MFTGLLFAMVFSLFLNFFIASIAWIPYRPVVASFLLIFSAILIGAMALG
jgi:hypothetical protein